MPFPKTEAELKVTKYRTAVAVCVHASRLLLDHDLPGLMKEIRMPEADKGLLESALPLWRWVKSAEEEHEYAHGGSHE